MNMVKSFLLSATILVAAVLSLGQASAEETVQEPIPSLTDCSGPNRAARKLTCIVDGDTGWQNGVKWRLLSVDTPETYQAECAMERSIGGQATQRLTQLMRKGYVINWSGDFGSAGRDLVTITLFDGSDAGALLIAEGLAQPWPNQGNVWCE